MACSCPKCNGSLQINIADVSEEAVSHSCPSCKVKLEIFRESFAGRALRKKGEIYCASCEKELGATLYCSGCGTPYPEYIIAETPEAGRRRRAKKRRESLRAFDFSMGGGMPKGPIGYNPEFKSSPSAPTKNINSTVKVLVTAVVVVLILATGGIFYKEYKQEKAYTEYFFKALYCIKSGRDLSFAACNKVSTEWRLKGDAGKPSGTLVSQEDIATLNNVKDSTDKLMQQMKMPPKKLVKVNDSIDSLYGAYQKLHGLAVAPRGDSLGVYTEAVNKADNDFNAAAQTFKTSLPPKMSEKLQKAKLKYKTLKDL